MVRKSREVGLREVKEGLGINGNLLTYKYNIQISTEAAYKFPKKGGSSPRLELSTPTYKYTISIIKTTDIKFKIRQHKSKIKKWVYEKTKSYIQLSTNHNSKT